MHYQSEDYVTDNRDLYTTELELPNGDKVVVDPWELLKNALENFDENDESGCLADLDALQSKAQKHLDQLMAED